MSAESRKRAVSALAADLRADVDLLRHLPPPAIPLTSGQRDAVLAEGRFADILARLQQLLASAWRHAAAEGPAISRELRPAAAAFTDEARNVARMLWLVSAFTASGDAAGRSTAVDLARDLARALEVIAARFDGGLVDPLPSLPSPSAVHVDDVPDPIATAFGVPSVDLLDATATPSDARVLAAFRNRLTELESRCAALLHCVTQPPIDVFAVTGPLLNMLHVERPLLAWTVAGGTLGMIRETAITDAAMVEEVFSNLRQRELFRTASRQRLVAAQATARTGGTQGSRGLAELSAYKILVEGQLRPWAWTLLRLNGADGPMPMLAELRDRLAASGVPLYEYLSGSIMVMLRNADAHEEAAFDELSGKVVTGEELVDPSQLRRANAKLSSLDAGLELALACARSSVEPVARAYRLKPGDPSTASEAMSKAKQRYGHAGLRVRSLRRDRSTVQVILDSIDPYRTINPCLLATVQAHQLMPGATRWQIGIHDGDGWVIDLPSIVLRENWPILSRAIQRFPAMPEETFLPCATWARLAVELPGQALRAAGWFALNGLQRAIDEAEERQAITGERLANIDWFSHRVTNVIGAAAATLRVMPREEAQPLELALDLARDIRYALTHSTATQALPVLIAEVLRERDRLPVPPVMPTLDSTPMEENAS